LRRIALTVGAVVLVAACGEARPPASDPTGIAWELTSGTVDGVPITLVEGYPITLSLIDEAVVGTSACNGYAGTYVISGDSLEFSGMGGTEMACSPAQVMESESEYLAALMMVESFTIGEDLTLTGEGVELVYHRIPPVPTADLTGTVWVLDGLVDGDVVSSVMGDRATLELFTDGSIIGSTGCRGLTGRYVVTGAEVQLPELAAEGECPGDLQAQDSHVVDVLGDGFRAEVDGRTLTLAAAGDQGLIYRAEG
jgi:heat shock protein HslJ